MTTNSLAPIANLLQQHRVAICDEWLNDIMRIWEHSHAGLVDKEEVSRQANDFLKELAVFFNSHSGEAPAEISTNSPFGKIACELSIERAKKGFKPADTAQYIITLKNVLTRHFLRTYSETPVDLALYLRVMNDMLDRISLLTFEMYVETRERIIAQQSLSLSELSTPIILLWNNVLLLPLVGVIDTVRARQFTERLLEAITRYEANVTIIDVTGVPVFDTSVARHFMKVIDAAQLLGSRIVMTGISPEGAQTLTKLGINFSNIISRATLRSGLAEALLLVGRRIELIGGVRP
ncbi:MAG TPA: STAS domain-containing protein [Desulfuromonadales bacterium]|nr:STAS domain-containing protein [Desulfuromonadales bacterium]